MTDSTSRYPSFFSIHQTVLDGHTISYALKCSFKAKHVRLVVSAETGLIIVVPVTYDARQLPGLLKEKSRWILDKLAKYSKVPRLAGGKELQSGDSIPYLGRRVKVVRRHNPGIADNINLERNRLLVNLNNKNIRLNLAVEWWYRQQAEKLIRKKVDELCPRLGVTCSRMRIRGAKTRWGSCSRKGSLNFNWKLMMVPEPVVDYVVIHELSHLKELNHTGKFWQVVAGHCPQWRKHRRWLRKHEAELLSKLSG